jgi:hypothetical protein
MEAFIDYLRITLRNEAVCHHTVKRGIKTYVFQLGAGGVVILKTSPPESRIIYLTSRVVDWFI